MRRSLVTGANRGLGLEFARQLLARGDQVFAACREPDKAAALAELGRAHADRLRLLALDLSDEVSIAALAKTLGEHVDALDVLINNAGALPSGERYGSLQAKTLADTFRSNVIGPLLLTQALTPLLQKGREAKVMNLSSRVGSIDDCGSFSTPSYRISKTALNMATCQLAYALSPLGVTAFCVHPGWVNTDMGGSSAPLTPPDSVSALLSVLDAVKPADAGRFLDRNGDSIPW